MESINTYLCSEKLLTAISELENCKNMKSYRSILGHLACLMAYSIFGFNIIVCKDLTSGEFLSPLAIFCLRAIGAGAIFWIISFFMPKEKVEKKDYLKIFAASVLGFLITQLSFLAGIPHITPMDCSILASISPIYTMFIAAIALKEPISLQKVSGVVISFVGIVYLIVSNVTGSATGQTNAFGIVMLIINSLSFSLYLGIFKPLISKYSVFTFMKWIFLFAFVMSFPFSAKEIFTASWSTVPAVQLYELAYLIICATFVTYTLIPLGQKIIRPTLVSMYSYMQPIIAIVISIWIGMDTITWQKVLAAVMVFGGVIIVSYSKSKVEKN